MPLQPEATAFGAHHGFVVDVPAAYRTTGKDQMERQVGIVLAQVLGVRSFGSTAGTDAVFAAWLPVR